MNFKKTLTNTTKTLLFLTLFLICQTSFGQCDSITDYLKRFPEDDRAYEYYGHCLFLSDGDLYEAIEAYGKSIYYAPPDSTKLIGNRYMSIAMMFTVLGKMDEACTYTHKAGEYGIDVEDFIKKHCLKQCSAMTTGGTRCKRNASVDSKYCWQHDN